MKKASSLLNMVSKLASKLATVAFAPGPTLLSHRVDLSEVGLLLLDFDGVLTDNSVIVSENGEEHVKCSRLDGIGLSKIRALGIAVCVVSTETNPVVSKRCEKLGLKVVQSVSDKGETVRRISSDLDVPLEKVMFLGNDVNDLPAFNIVGIPVAVNDSHADVMSAVRYVTACRGGEGCVREVCDYLARARFRAHG